MATQPGTGLTLFGNNNAAVPAHIAQFFAAEGTNIQSRTSVPSLSPEGKTWTISLDGQKHKMQRRNADGDIEPLPIMKAVILEYNKERGRAYYEGEYDPANASPPICWSADGVAPDSSLPGPFAAGTEIEPGKSRKISAKCADCPMAVKGSKVTPQGKSVSACSQHKMIAIVPDPALGLPVALQKPLRLKLAMTSVWDKQSPDQEAQGWLAFDNYVDWLLARGCQHTAAIVTKMKFDPDAAYPKIFFSAERPLEANELAVVGPLLHSDDVKKLLGDTWTPAGADGVPKDQQDVATPVGSEPVAAQPDTAVAAAAAPPPAAVPEVLGMPEGYEMRPDDGFAYSDYRASGWTDEVLIANGKLIAVKPPAPAPAEVVQTPPPPAAQADVVIVGEPAAGAATSTPAAPSSASTDSVVVTEVAPASAPFPAAAPEVPAAVVVQEPAQGSAPAPVATPQAPEPPAAAAAAAAASPAVSTNVPPDVEALLTEWA